jgi:hypothetical protein
LFVLFQGVVYQLDVALESVDTQRSGLVFIYDMSDSKYANFDYDLSQKILTLLKVITSFTSPLFYSFLCFGSGSNWGIQSPRRGIHDNTNYVTFPSPILNCVCNLGLVTGEPASQRRHDNQHMIRPQSPCLFISLRILVHVNVIPEYLDLLLHGKLRWRLRVLT